MRLERILVFFLFFIYLCFKMTALELYIDITRDIMQANINDFESWTEITNNLPRLRNCLSCRVCSKILHIPMGPKHGVCLHLICKNCVGGEMKMKPSCSWCKNYENFEERLQIRILIQCYKKLCEYLAEPDISQILQQTDTSTETILQEGIAISDDFNFSGPGPFLKSKKVYTNIKSKKHKNSSMKQNCGKKLVAGNKLKNVKESNVSCIKPVKNDSSETIEKCVTNHTSTNKQFEIPISVDSETDYTTAESDNSSPDKDKGKSNSNQPVSIQSLEQNTNVSNNMKSELLVPSLESKKSECFKTVSKIIRNEQLAVSEVRNAQQAVSALVCLSEHDYMKDSPLIFGQNSCTTGDTTVPNAPKLKSNVSDSSMTIRKRLKLEGDILGNNPSILKRKTPKLKKEKHVKRQGCRCGTATPTPGKLTCCGQRCPCYTAHKQCFDCSCRGCRNPRKDQSLIHSHLSIEPEMKIECSEEAHDINVEN